MPQLLDNCRKQLSAKVIARARKEQRSLQAFGPQLAEITHLDQEQIDVEAILEAAPFSIQYNDRQIITSVYWK